MMEIFSSRVFRIVLINGFCVDASGSTSEFVVSVVGSGARYLNGVNSGSGIVEEHDTPADATATQSPPYPQGRSTYQSLFHPMMRRGLGQPPGSRTGSLTCQKQKTTVLRRCAVQKTF